MLIKIFKHSPLIVGIISYKKEKIVFSENSPLNNSGIIFKIKKIDL